MLLLERPAGGLILVGLRRVVACVNSYSAGALKEMATGAAHYVGVFTVLLGGFFRW